MKIDFANLKYQHNLYQSEIEKAILNIARKCNFIMGEDVKKLEENLERFTGAKYAIACGSGTDALILALMTIGIQPDDEIITTPFTFIATAESIAVLGAKPVFVDIDEQTYNIDTSKIEEKITSKTKAIIPVNLYGQPSDLNELKTIANKYGLSLIIDGAQSFGSTYRGVPDSNFGDISITSFFPAKPLGCYGDGGAIFTNNDEIASVIKSLRVHGQTKRYYHKYVGFNARIDTIQAAVLNIKLNHYNEDLALRQQVARKYSLKFKDLDIVLPHIKQDRTSSWAQYSVRINKNSKTNREIIKEELNQSGIPTAIHYPMPLHQQECFKYLGYKQGDFPVSEKVSKEILSLPMNPYLTDEEIEYIYKKLKELL